jgi:hypothetical protein
MELMPKDLLEKLPKLRETKRQEDPMVICKFFYPDFSWTWYAIEFDGEDIFFGYVAGDFPELGYFSLNELKSNRGKLGLPIERDLYFDPQPLSKIRSLHE